MVVLGVPGASFAQPSWNDTLAFPSGRHAEMQTLLERTIFRVDVLTLRVRYDSNTAQSVRRLNRRSMSEKAFEDSVALAVIGSEDLLAEIVFLREISLDQFLDGIDEDMAMAARAGFLSDSVHRAVMAGLPASFAFLRERRIRKGDRISYRLHGNTLRTAYRDATGTVLLDQVDRGRERRMSVIATFLAPGSSFRSGLLESLPE
jgi:hypothetical protein